MSKNGCAEIAQHIVNFYILTAVYESTASNYESAESNYIKQKKN